jgi:LPS-assembly protein
VEVTLEGHGKVRHVAFRIRDLPVFYLPYARFPVRTKRKSGVLPPRFGYSNRNGFGGELPIYWAISEQTDATFYERYMSERGLMQGLEFRYVAEEDSRGDFLFDILADRKEEKDLTNPDEIEVSPLPRTNSTRYWLRSRTNQQLPWGLGARLDTDYVSDQDYLREFWGGLLGYDARPDLEGEYGRPLEEVQSPTRRSALRISRDGEQYTLQGQGAYHERPENPPDDDTPQPLAALNYEVLPRPLPSLPLYFNFKSDYAYLWREVGVTGHSVAFAPALSYPFFFGRFLQLEPEASYRKAVRWFDGGPETGDYYNRDAFEVGARLSTVLERVFDYKWRDAKRFKHKFFPSLAYSYRIANDSGVEAWLDPREAEGTSNRVVLFVDNLLDARREDDKGEVTYNQWGLLRLSQAYNIHEARRDDLPSQEKETFGPLVGLLTLKPYSDLYLRATAGWDHKLNALGFNVITLAFSVDRSGGRKDRYKIDYTYTKGERENLNFYIDLNLLYGFSAGTSLKRDLEFGYTNESRFWLEYESQCWAVRVETGQLDELEAITVSFRLLGLGSTK